MQHLLVNFVVGILASGLIRFSQVTSDDPCSGQLCHTQLTCSSYNSGPCLCNMGFIRPNCSDNDECSNAKADPCHHKGTCINTVGSFVCQCLSGWSGQHCDTRVSDNATCMPGYHGEYCDETNCINGYPAKPDTNNSSFAIICICDEGWTQTKNDSACNIDVNECEGPKRLCYNVGSCRNINGSYDCDCIHPWGGQTCSENITKAATSSTSMAPLSAMNHSGQMDPQTSQGPGAGLAAGLSVAGLAAGLSVGGVLIIALAVIFLVLKLKYKQAI